MTSIILLSLHESTVVILRILGVLLLSSVSLADRPNVVWFVVDDMSANFSCYGERTIQTPHVDQLAETGIRFSQAYATAPVCSPFRSALITGMYQTTIGSHHHRSGRGEHHISLPNHVQPIPAIFQKAGYWTCNGSGLPANQRPGKTDYNFDWDPSIYDSHDWKDRAPGQPFFMQVQLLGGKLRGASASRYSAIEKRAIAELGSSTNADSVQLPPYYPRDEILLQDWATYLDSVRLTDHHIGQVVQRLKHEAIFENTIIVFFTDHGISHARGKQFLFDEGTHIPLIICGPGIPSRQTRDDLIEHIDIAALTLAAAGIDLPDHLQGENILAADYQPKPAVFAARDRCGEAVDRIRSVRTDRFLYIRNFYPQLPPLAPSNYKDSKLILQRLRELHEQGQLNDVSERLLFAENRPNEELYEYKTDRWQLHNLADNQQYASVLKAHRERLKTWITETKDQGSEDRETYDLEIADQMKTMKRERDRNTYRSNAAKYHQWIYSDK